MTTIEAARAQRRLVPTVFHVGLRKTGTTFLQKRLLPLFADRALYVKNMTQLAAAGAAERRPVILSNESLTHVGASMTELDRRAPETIAAINPDARIIISIRSQYTILRSMYALDVKMGYAERYPAFLERVIASGTLDYFSIVESFRKQFGNDNVAVVLFEQMVREPDTAIRQIAASLGVSAPTALPNDSPERETAGDLFIEMGRLANRILGPRPGGWRRAAKFLVQVSAHKLDRGKPWLFDTRPLYGRLREAFAESNQRLFRTLGANKYSAAYPGLEEGSATPATSA